MSLTCIYHPTLKMRVVNFEERDKLIESGIWFDDPLEAEVFGLKEIKNEKIRQVRKNGKNERSSKTIE